MASRDITDELIATLGQISKTIKGQFVGQFSISTSQGGAFGVATSSDNQHFAAVNDVYRDRRMPYTVGLLGSVPRLDSAQGTRVRFSLPAMAP